MTTDIHTDSFSRVKTGDVQAYELLFKQFYQRLCHYAFVLLKDMDESEETVQQVFIAIWDKKDQIEIETSLQSYLYRAVNNACLNKIKQQKTRSRHHDHIRYASADSDHSTGQAVISKELEENIYAAVDRLPEQCGLIFRLSRFEGMRYQQIADELGISVKTVENQLGKALKLMREELRDYLPLIILLFPHLMN